MSRQKWTVDAQAFDSIDRVDKAYWLGFLFADGGLDKHGRTVRVRQKDKEILERFREFMCTDVPVRPLVYSSPGGVECHGWQVALYSAHLWRSLNALGCTPRKSLTKTFPNIPSQFARPFIAGYLDGNGWIGRRAGYPTLVGYITTGSVQFAQELSERLRVAWMKQGRGSTFRVRLGVGHILDLLPYSSKIQKYEV